MSQTFEKFSFLPRMMKCYILAEHKYLTKNLILRVIQCTSSHLTYMVYMVFTLYMIGLISVNIKDNNSWLSLKNHAEHFSIWGSSSAFLVT